MRLLRLMEEQKMVIMATLRLERLYWRFLPPCSEGLLVDLTVTCVVVAPESILVGWIPLREVVDPLKVSM